MKGDNLGSHDQKRSHVRASVGNAMVSLRETLGAPVTEILEQQLEGNLFYLGGLHRPTERIPRGFIREMHDLMGLMQKSAESPPTIDARPNYRISRLELALRDATGRVQEPLAGQARSRILRRALPNNIGRA